MHDFWHLSSVNWLQELSDGETRELQEGAACREYAPGEMIFAPTASPHSVYLLARGLARIYRLSDAGDETTFGYVAPGEVFGELAAFGSHARESFAQAVKRSSVWRIPREAFRRAVASRPSLMLEVTKQIGQRMKRIESRVEHLVFRDVRSRVARVLTELAEDFGRREGDRVTIDLPLTQAELATLVGSTRQSVNTSLGQLEAEGLILRERRRIVLVKPDAVRQTATTPPAG